MGIAVYFEPRDAKSMTDTLSSYYSAIDNVEASSSSSRNTTGKAILVAVCRGKVSEGINFTDSYARAVIVVGIPYPSTTDDKIRLKKEYQTQKAAKNKIYADGDAWYRQQAFRAVNQAVGRCIRHKNDFGAIYLLDPRFSQENVANQMSKWIKNQLVPVNRLEDTLVELSLFYRRLLPVNSPYLRSSDECSNTAAAPSSENNLNEVQNADSAAVKAASRSTVSSVPPQSMKKGKRKGDSIATGASIMEAFKKVPVTEGKKRDIEQVYPTEMIEETAPKFDPHTPGNMFTFIVSPRALAAIQFILQQWKWDTSCQENYLSFLPDNLNYVRKGFDAYFQPNTAAAIPYPVATPRSIDFNNTNSLQSSSSSASSSFSSSSSASSSSSSTLITDGIDLQDIVIQEFWDSADGVAYKTLHVASLNQNRNAKSSSELTSNTPIQPFNSSLPSSTTSHSSGRLPDYLLIAAEIMATAKDQSNLVGKCYAHLDLLELVRGSLCFDGCSAPLREESRSDSIGYL